MEPREGLPQPRNTQPSAKQVLHIKDNFQTYLADRQVGPLIRTQEGGMDLGERGGAAVTPGLLLLFLVSDSIAVSRFMQSDGKVQITAPGKHRVSTPISRARVICPRASFVPEDLWEEILGARHLVNDARICGTNFWRDMTRASKLPHFQNFARIFKILPISKILPDFQIFA